jgi:hypothetical protein
VINVAAMFDELVKIGETPASPEFENLAPPTELPPNDRAITKDRLKRALIASGVIGAGAGIGHGLGSLAKRYVWKNQEKLAPYLKYGPAAMGGLTALGGVLLAEQRRRADEYITGKRLHG